MVDVFMSHASGDHAVAEMLVKGLERSGRTCWIAPRDVVVGEDYAAGIVKALRASRVMVFLISANSLSSPNCLAETRKAFDLQLPILTVRIDDAPLTDVFDYYVGNVQWIRYEGALTVDALIRKLSRPPERRTGPSEPDRIDLFLTEVGPRKLEVVKLVRELSHIGLAECMDAMNALPHRIASGVTRDEAEALAGRFHDLGARVDQRRV